MKIFTSIEMQWDGTKYTVAKAESFEYNGPVDQCCGATGDQNKIQSAQENIMNTATQQAGEVFGKGSSVFDDLVNTFAPTVAAGPSQMGFNQQQLSNLNSQAITQNGVAAKNAKQAAGDSMAAAGGGNTVLPSGTNAQVNANIDTAAASNTANDLSAITEKGYEVGRENYDTAAAGLMNAPSVFNGATSATSTAAGAGSDAANTANQIATQQNSWVQGVTGALGGIAGAALGGGGILGSALGGIAGAAVGGGESPSVFNGAQNTLPTSQSYNFGTNPLPASPMPTF